MHPLIEQFDLLLDLTEPQRAAELSRIEQTDPAMAKALRAMLEADALSTRSNVPGLAHELTQQPPLVQPDLTGAVGAALANTDRSGQQLGNYQIIRALGEGGMGSVWLAERKLEQTTQPVAIKFLHAHASAAFFRHFARERENLSKLQHPGIARLIDAGQMPNGEPFIATEFIDGEPLMAHAKALDLPARLHLIEQLCEAVNYAHQRLIVHRDIKPSNVLVDRDGNPKLLDFGIAKSLDHALTQLTHDNPLSPAYAAPEQAAGEAISTATDVFALGLILFEMLTGSLPGKRAKQSGAALISEITNETIEPPSRALLTGQTTLSGFIAQSPQAWRKQVSGDLDLIVLKALKREPERRYASALALAEDLRRFRAGRAIQARPDSAWYRLQKLVARNPWTVAAIGLSLVVIIGLSILAGFASVAANASAAKARLQTIEAQKNAQAAQEAFRQSELVNTFFSLRIQEAQVRGQASGVNLTFKDWLLAALPRLDSELASAPLARAALRRELAASLTDLGEIETALQQAKLAVEEARQSSGAGLATAKALSSYAMALNESGQLENAKQALLEALAILAGLPQDNALRQQRSATNSTLFRIYNALGDYQQAKKIALDALNDRAQLYGADSFELASDYNNVSIISARLGDLAEAEKNALETRARLAKDPNKPIARLATSDTGLCVLMTLRGNAEQAIAFCERAISLAEPLIGKDHFQVLGQRLALATALLNNGAPAQANAELQQIAPKVRAQKLPLLPDVLVLQARLGALNNQWPEVLRWSDESLSIITTQQAQATAVYQRAKLMRALAMYALAPTAQNQQALADLAQAMMDSAKEAYLHRAFAAFCWYQGLSLSQQTQAAEQAKTKALQMLQHDMSAEKAQLQWQHWLAK